jgi:hypothetical protein
MKLKEEAFLKPSKFEHTPGWHRGPGYGNLRIACLQLMSSSVWQCDLSFLGIPWSVGGAMCATVQDNAEIVQKALARFETEERGQRSISKGAASLRVYDAVKKDGAFPPAASSLTNGSGVSYYRLVTESSLSLSSAASTNGIHTRVPKCEST